MLGRRAKRGRAVKKRWIFTGVAGLLAALFLGGVAAVGASTGWFGIEELASREEDSQWPYRYQTSWDPTDRGMEGLRTQEILAMLGQTVQLLQALLDKDESIYIGDEEIYRAAGRGSREAGCPVGLNPAFR